VVHRQNDGGFPVSAGILFGLGLGGFFDGIILHQVLQWHHMLTSAGFPADSVRNLEINVMWDGIFHMSTYLFTALACTSYGATHGRTTSAGPVSSCREPS
jgi:uncharacterized membrane protein